MRLLKKEVRAWLKSKPKDEVVGKAGFISACPLANFLREAKNDPTPIIGGISYDAADGKDQPLPAWAGLFIAHIDVSAYGEVTAAQALEALNKR